MESSLLSQYWYAVGESHDITGDKVLARQVLDEWLACYRDEKGQVVVARDRCIHRCARLSCGTVHEGKLTCGYHGWVYGSSGQVVSIPSETQAEHQNGRRLQAKTYPVVEQDGYVYVCLEPGSHTPPHPFYLSGLRGRVRLQNRFQNTLANCVENYIDVPHTAYVHHGIFRKPRKQALHVTVQRKQGEIHVTYEGENFNLGSFSWFLNPKKEKVAHTDHFYAPNITAVHYHLPRGYRYSITSQSVPVSVMENTIETMVYTDITYDLGFWTPFSSGLVRRQAQKVIDQDIEILNQQGENIKKYGQHFCPTSADTIHTLTSEIIDHLMKGKSPDTLPDKNEEVTFSV